MSGKSEIVESALRLRICACADADPAYDRRRGRTRFWPRRSVQTVPREAGAVQTSSVACSLSIELGSVMRAPRAVVVRHALKALETSHDRRASVPGLGPRERDPLESRRSARNDGARLHARELRADALVHSVPERCVLGPLACDVESSGLAECRLVAVRRSCQQDHAFAGGPG